MNEHWQYSELKQFLNRQSSQDPIETGSVYLSDPEFREKIDAIIVNNIWPSIQEAVKKSPVSVMLAGNDLDIYKNIEEKRYFNTTRALIFILTDPERPTGTGSCKWYFRGEIECSASHYMIRCDFYIYFPESFDINKIISLLKNSAFTGMPPELSYEEGLFILKFTGGIGAGGGPFLYAEQAEYQIFDEIQKNLEIIYTINTLEIDFNKDKSFQLLCDSLILAYENN